ncbi:MAG: sigma-70 family RNA polymerase sigma factor [Lachnospiraceae bacterium]
MREDFYQVIKEYIVEKQNKFYRLAYSYTRNQEDALDAVQNAVCKILEHYKEIQNENAVRTWVYRIIVNESLRLLKEKKRQDWLKNNTDGEGVYEERRFDVQDDLYEQINNLDTETQTIIKLRFYEDLTLKEIAEITEMNLNTVKAKLYRGLQALKVWIKEDSI